MARPLKQLSVTPEKRRNWLQRHEENGDSAPQIARREGYDVRTVRKQLELARHERETRETRLFVLREAAQAHYADLLRRATEIESELGSGGFEGVYIADRLGTALRQHLPKAPLWKYLDKWNELAGKNQQVKSSLADKLKNEIQDSVEFQNAFSEGQIDIDGLTGVMLLQVKMWSAGASGLDVETNFRTEPVEGDVVNFRYGAWGLGTGKLSQKPKIKKAITQFEKGIRSFNELSELTETLAELRRLIEVLEEELATITLKRVLPGHCKYCPI